MSNALKSYHEKRLKCCIRYSLLLVYKIRDEQAPMTISKLSKSPFLNLFFLLYFQSTHVSDLKALEFTPPSQHVSVLFFLYVYNTSLLESLS